MAVGNFTVKISGVCPSGDHLRLAFTVETPTGLRTFTREIHREDMLRAITPDEREEFALNLVKRFTRSGTFLSKLDFKVRLEAEVFSL